VQSKTVTEVEDDILSVVERITTACGHAGLGIKGYSKISYNKYRQLPEEIQKQILAGLTDYASLLETVNPALPKIDYEISTLELAERKLNLRVPDDFKRVIKSGDIVEIYDLERNTQLYRNSEFLIYSSYDLLTVCAYSWPELFERSPKFEKLVLDRSAEVARTSVATVPWNIEDHYLKEKLDARNNVFKMKMGYVSPVYSSMSGDRRAWASTLRVQPMGSSWKDCDNVIAFS